ncbi:hypothetical protein CYLTODRAFT_253196 [Cylindrobasidium torrendii FP15055 ss-10]|uniref:Uncharacterized protein n=1 Tax=Cylindrobasidium torrendii FP15055 ss-10 TaxID=1314674 RepID=A0A0D7BDU0_9AGAR|nr:hypothetical protein CYLTODRAFT_253196 [Cylindrobasidium torrendii FP15055 ss-10]
MKTRRSRRVFAIQSLFLPARPCLQSRIPISAAVNPTAWPLSKKIAITMLVLWLSSRESSRRTITPNSSTDRKHRRKRLALPSFLQSTR